MEQWIGLYCQRLDDFVVYYKSYSLFFLCAVNFGISAMSNVASPCFAEYFTIIVRNYVNLTAGSVWAGKAGPYWTLDDRPVVGPGDSPLNS